jgi:hypothetical protein
VPKLGALWKEVSPPRGRGMGATDGSFQGTLSITPTGAGRGGTADSRCLNSDITLTGVGDGTGGSLPWHHDATGAGTGGLLRPHHHGLKDEARLGSWTADLA